MRPILALFCVIALNACSATLPPPVEVRGSSPIIVDPRPDPSLPPNSTVIVPR